MQPLHSFDSWFYVCGQYGITIFAEHFGFSTQIGRHLIIEVSTRRVSGLRKRVWLACIVMLTLLPYVEGHFVVWGVC